LMGVVTEYDVLRDLPSHGHEAHFTDNADTEKRLTHALDQIAALQREYLALFDIVNNFRVAAFASVSQGRDRLRRAGLSIPDTGSTRKRPSR
jgi:hypothetical protein